MLVLQRQQFHDVVLGRRDWLIRDIEQYLRRFRREIVEAYPGPYLRWVIDDGVSIALQRGLRDVEALCVFVRLRWDIAPGFYRQPQIAQVLADTTLTPMQRLERLADEAYGTAWEEALAYDGPDEWRARFWDGPP